MLTKTDQTDQQFNQCCVCGVRNKSVELQISRSQLIFGGFRGITSEYRCNICERKLVKRVTSMLKNI